MSEEQAFIFGIVFGLIASSIYIELFILDGKYRVANKIQKCN